jgi:hypothetical protein
VGAQLTPDSVIVLPECLSVWTTKCAVGAVLYITSHGTAQPHVDVLHCSCWGMVGTYARWCCYEQQRSQRLARNISSTLVGV